MIVNLVLAEVRDWMRGENRYLPPQLETQISLWVSGQYLPLYLTAQNGLERFLAVIEDKILNGWVFGNTKEEHPWSRKLSLEVRGQMLDEWQKASWRDCSGVVTTVLGNYLMSHFFFGDEKGDDEVHEIFAEVMKDFGNSDLDEFFAQFEGRVLNHPRLKERPPRSSDQEELFGT